MENNKPLCARTIIGDAYFEGADLTETQSNRCFEIELPNGFEVVGVANGLTKVSLDSDGVRHVIRSLNAIIDETRRLSGQADQQQAA
jgi:hypothetical protein